MIIENEVELGEYVPLVNSKNDYNILIVSIATIKEKSLKSIFALKKLTTINFYRFYAIKLF